MTYNITNPKPSPNQPPKPTPKNQTNRPNQHQKIKSTAQLDINKSKILPNLAKFKELKRNLAKFKGQKNRPTEHTKINPIAQTNIKKQHQPPNWKTLYTPNTINEIWKI